MQTKKMERIVMTTKPKGVMIKGMDMPENCKSGAVYGPGVVECWRCNRIDNPFYYKTFC